MLQIKRRSLYRIKVHRLEICWRKVESWTEEGSDNRGPISSEVTTEPSFDSPGALVARRSAWPDAGTQ